MSMKLTIRFNTKLMQGIRQELRERHLMVATVLLAILMSTSLVRLLGQAVNQELDPTSVLYILLLTSLSYLPIILILSLFIATLLMMTRLYRDSEMVVWQASGISLLHWIRPCLHIGIPTMGLVATLSLMVMPWANQRIVDYKQRYQQRETTARATPGQFNESADGSKVFFMEQTAVNPTPTPPASSTPQSTTQNLKHIFLFTRDTPHASTASSAQQPANQPKTSILLAQRGDMITQSDGNRYLVFTTGQRYDLATAPDFERFTLLHFMRYAILIAQGVSNDGTVIQVKQVPSITLWHIMQATNKVTPSNTIAAPQLTIAQASAEMMWRLSLPLMTLTLMLLAIPLGYVNPRQGRSLHLLTALMIYLVYSNLVSIIQAWIAQDKMVWWVGLCAIHSAILGLIGGWLWYRVRGAR